MSDADLKALEDRACPGAGACGGQYTANTMAMALEFLGLSPMGTASVAATDPGKARVAEETGGLVLDMLRRDLRPRAIATRAAYENAIAGVAASGGSTNAVLHFLAMAAESDVPLAIEDFDVISRRTPLLADLKPGGRFTAVDLGRAGGTGVLAARLVEAQLVDGSAVTASGRTFAEEAARAVEVAGQEVVRPLAAPLKKTGGLVILKGNLAPEGCVVKVAGHERMHHRGPARIFEREEDAMAAATSVRSMPATSSSFAMRVRAAVPACAKCSASPRRSWVPGSASRWRLTDGRFSGATRGLMAGHVAPEAAVGGPIAALEEGDVITFDIAARRLDVDVSDAVLHARLARWQAPEPRYRTGVMAKYVALVSSASTGAVTRPPGR